VHSYKFLAVLGLGLISSSTSLAQISSSCAAVYADAVASKNRFSRDFNHNEYAFDRYCDSNGNRKSFSLSSSDEAIINAIPFKSTLGISASSERLSQFCRDYRSHMNTSEYVTTSQIIPDVSALRSFNQCMALERLGINLSQSYSPLAPKIVTAQISFDPTQTNLILSSVGYSDNISECSTNDINVNGGKITLDGAKAHNLNRTTLITCRRKSTPDYGGEGFRPAAVQLGLNSSIYTLEFPSEGIQGPVLVSEAQSRISNAEAAEKAAISEAQRAIESAKKRWSNKKIEQYYIFRSSSAIAAVTRYPQARHIGCGDAAADAKANFCKKPGDELFLKQAFSHSGGTCGNTLFTVTCIRPGE
jgi:hypothetical protein